MEISENYKDLKYLKSFLILKEHGLGILKETLENFLNCKVTYLFEPVRQAKKLFDIDLLLNIKRGCYPINNDTFFIYARVLESNVLISGIGIIITRNNVNGFTKFLNTLEGALAKKLSFSYSSWFENSSMLFGDELIKHCISNYCGRGHYDYRQFHHIIEYFQKLKSTTFEGDSFSTGMIITKSHFAYKKKGDENRYGDIYPLVEKVDLRHTYNIDRRFWYLADGKHCYFVSNKDLKIGHLFIIDNEYGTLDYIDSNSLSMTIKGGDILLKIENEKNFSIIDSDGIEFLYLENRWKIRNYAIVKDEMSKLISQPEIINRLLFFILFCSKNSISSVIWIPEEISTLKDFVKENTLNKLIHHSIPILEKKYTNHIMRYLSSDGATIIDKDGNLIYYGSIVEMKNLEIKGVKGTGESAAEVLSKNGISFKISQDGTIKMFSSKSDKMLII